jgi:CubicO group peptidase (beta-lactamase class C family)
MGILTMYAWAISSFQGPVIPVASRKAPELIGQYDWQQSKIPVNGTGSDALTAFDKAMVAYLREACAPGAALTVYYQGKKIYSKGFGYADIEAQIPFSASTPSRISSLSKFLTQRAIQTLLERGQLSKDAKVIDILKKGGVVPLSPKGKKPDSRLSDITVQNLLDHKSGIRQGLDISVCTSDTMIAELALRTPVQEKDALGYILGLPLDNDPGQTYSYSNFGYGLLSKIVELISHLSYEEYVRANVLGPMTDSSQWFVTSTLRKEKRATEANYYSFPGHPTWDAYRFDFMQGAGGWVAPVDGIAEFFSRTFPGKGWDYTLFGSYTGAVTVMKVHSNSLVYAASVNYRRGNDAKDNEILFKRLEDVAKELNYQSMSQ